MKKNGSSMVLLNGLFLDTNLIIIPEKHDNFGK